MQPKPGANERDWIMEGNLPPAKPTGTTLSLAITPVSMAKKAVPEVSEEQLMADLASREERQQREGIEKILNGITLPPNPIWSVHVCYEVYMYVMELGTRYVV